jgi:hypothetical protein
MTAREQLPDDAICHVCGSPMKVIDLAPLAKELGVHVPREHSYSIECCDFELTVDDDEEFRHLCELLREYHRTNG